MEIPEVVITLRGNKHNWNMPLNNAYNIYLMMNKVIEALSNWNYDVNSSNMGQYIMNSKASMSTAAAENFLFLELPASFVGGEFLSAGWRAANLSRYICGPLGRISNGLIRLCFTEGTLVATEKGNKKIEDIKEGDLVWSYNEETGKKELKKVVDLSRNTSYSLVKISVNGTEITCTPEHPFYVNGNWIEAKDLIKGMLLTNLDGTYCPIESINFLNEKVKVYNFEVEDNHNYYVSEKGILVHNDCLKWLSKARSLNVIKNGCEAVADRVVGSLGKGAEYLQITPFRGAGIGDVAGQSSGWLHHVAGIKDGIVYDRLTGRAGMMIEDYIKLFDYSESLNFEVTATRTLK